MNQNDIDKIFCIRFGFAGTTGFIDGKEDTDLIKRVINQKYNIQLSTSEALDFWLWRCEQWDADWLSLSESDIISWFQEFIFFYKDDIGE